MQESIEYRKKEQKRQAGREERSRIFSRESRPCPEEYSEQQKHVERNKCQVCGAVVKQGKRSKKESFVAGVVKRNWDSGRCKSVLDLRVLGKIVEARRMGSYQITGGVEGPEVQIIRALQVSGRVQLHHGQSRTPANQERLGLSWDGAAWNRVG